MTPLRITSAVLAIECRQWNSVVECKIHRMLARRIRQFTRSTVIECSLARRAWAYHKPKTSQVLLHTDGKRSFSVIAAVFLAIFESL